MILDAAALKDLPLEDSPDLEFYRNLLEENAKLRAQVRGLTTKPERNDAALASRVKTDGVLKATPCDPIRSYSDYCAIRDYFLAKKNYRDYALWQVGVATGLRASDLVSLPIESVFDKEMHFREKLRLVEKKTGKVHQLLITDAVKEAVSTMIEHRRHVEYDEALFRSRKHEVGQSDAITPHHAYRVLNEAAKALNLPIHVGSHTMRKSFACIVACVDSSVIDMNMITKVQGLLNHSDPRITMRYLGVLDEMYDRARVVVSDFILGKTKTQDLVVGQSHSVDEVFERIEELSNKLK